MDQSTIKPISQLLCLASRYASDDITTRPSEMTTQTDDSLHHLLDTRINLSIPMPASTRHGVLKPHCLSPSHHTSSNGRATRPFNWYPRSQASQPSPAIPKRSRPHADILNSVQKYLAFPSPPMSEPRFSSSLDLDEDETVIRDFEDLRNDKI